MLRSISIYHYYRQDRASDDLCDVSLEIDPDGRNVDLGQGLDLVIGYRPIKNTAVKLVFGAFFPGNAFPDDADNAYFGELELSYRF